MYGEIIAQYIMKPDIYEIWSRRDNNIFVSPNAADDIVDHYELIRNDVISFYTLNNRLLADRDFAELHGLDMSDDDVLLRDLNRLGFISKLGSEHFIDYDDDNDYQDYDIYIDQAKTINNEDIVVMMLINAY